MTKRSTVSAGNVVKLLLVTIIGVTCVVMIAACKRGAPSSAPSGQADDSQASNEPAPEEGRGPKCVANGIAYYKEIGSYPKLSDGRLAVDVVGDRCARSLQAFPDVPNTKTKKVKK